MGPSGLTHRNSCIEDDWRVTRTMATRKRFGEICVELSYVSREDLARALQIQKELQAGGMDPPFIGEILVREGFISAEQRDQALESSGDIPADFLPGYEILGRIGRGARGIVYKARQKSMDRLVALKILPRTVAEDRKYSEKFTREAKSVARLNHPNIISGIDVGEHEGCHFFVMEFVDGTSMAALLRNGPQSEERVLPLVKQIAQALEHAHSHGIVHRDIKPDNVLITRDGVAKLCDYGLAGQVVTSAPGQRLKRVEGTPHYISPEQAKGLPDIDIRSDLYSLGATVYHLLAGEPPFQGAEPAEIMRKHLSQELPSLREKGITVRPSLQRLVERLLEKDREKRFQNPRELLDAIGGLGKGPRRGGGDAAAVFGWRERKRRQLVGAGIGGAAFAVLLGAALFALQGTEPSGKTPANPEVANLPRPTGPIRPPSTGPTSPVVKPPPTAIPITREEKEAQGAWELLMEMEVEAARSLDGKQKLIEALRGFVQKYGRTEPGRDASLRLTTEELAFETLLDREFARLDKAVTKKMEAGDFIGAASLASEFQEKYDNPSFALSAASLVQQVETKNEKAFKELEKKADALLEKLKFQAAAALFSELVDRSTERVAERCREKVATIDALLAKRERRALLTDFRGKIDAFVQENRFDDALEDCRKMLQGEVDSEVVAEVESQRDILGRLKKTHGNLKASLEGKRGESIRITLTDGEEWEGRITDIQPETLRITLKPKGQTDSITLELSRLSAEMLEELSRGEPPDPEDPLNGAIFFLAKGNYPPAHRLFQAAQRAGVRVPDWVPARLEALGKTYLEAETVRLLASAREKMDLKAWKGARDLLQRIVREFSGTETYKENEGAIKKDLRSCWVEIIALDGPKAIVKAEVDRLKNGVYRFYYDFEEEEQLEDWVPDTQLFPAASRKHRGKVMEVLGKVNHRVQFVGDIQVEFSAESRALRNPNINLILHDGAKRGYLFGLGFKPGGGWLSLQINRGDGAPNRRLLLPGNVILRWLRPPDVGAEPEEILEALRRLGIWGEMKPVVGVKRKYKVKVAHTGNVLKFGGGGRTLIQMQEANDDDTGGRVAFIPYGSTLLVHRIEITGRPDPDWLKREVGRRVDQSPPGE